MELLTLPHVALSVTQLLSVRGPQSALTCLGESIKAPPCHPDIFSLCPSVLRTTLAGRYFRAIINFNPSTNNLLKFHKGLSDTPTQRHVSNLGEVMPSGSLQITCHRTWPKLCSSTLFLICISFRFHNNSQIRSQYLEMIKDLSKDTDN